MTLNKDYQYTILCEDKQTQCFVRYFLQAQNIHRRKIYCCPLPAGTQCGEQYVRIHYPEQLHVLRAKNFNRRVLVVCIDADTGEVEEHCRQLELACATARPAIKNRADDEPVIYFIPKRNIETWIHFFSEEPNANENTVYRHNTGDESGCKPYAEKMSIEFAEEKNITGFLPSIAAAFTEYKRVCQIL